MVWLTLQPDLDRIEGVFYVLADDASNLPKVLSGKLSCDATERGGGCPYRAEGDIFDSLPESSLLGLRDEILGSDVRLNDRDGSRLHVVTHLDV